MKYTSWNTIKKSTSIQLIEDPMLSIEINKADFEDTYKSILETFDENIENISENYTSSMDYYFTKHPLRNYTLIFKDDKVKNQFYDIGTKLNTNTDYDNILNGTYNDNDINNDINNDKNDNNDNNDNDNNDNNDKSIVTLVPTKLFYVYSLCDTNNNVDDYIYFE